MNAKFLIVTLLALTISACIKEPKSGFTELGTPANPEDIERALGKALSGTSVHQAKVGQYVHYEINYKADLGNVTKVIEQMRELVEIKDSPSDRTYVFLQDLYRFNSAGKLVDELHNEVGVSYDKNPPTINELRAMVAEDSKSCGKPVTDEDGRVYDCVGFYNFSTMTGQQEVPDLARTRPNCANIPNCKLPVEVIKFDRVKFYKDQIVDREKMAFSVSKLVPVLFPDQDDIPFTYYCIGKLESFDGKAYWVNQCKVLRDLQL